MKLGFFSLLTLMFIGLKLTNFIAWSWLWVLSPLWIPLAISLTIVIIIAMVSGVDEAVSVVNKASKK